MARLKCQRCATTFDARADAKYCSVSCRSAAAKERRHSRAQPLPEGQQRRSTALTSALTRAVRKLPRTAHDAGVVALARAYARALDADPDTLGKLGPQYLTVLGELGMTRGRARTLGTAGQLDLTPQPTTGKPATSSEQPSKLDQLRARRDARGQ